MECHQKDEIEPKAVHFRNQTGQCRQGHEVNSKKRNQENLEQDNIWKSLRNWKSISPNEEN
jgi:hypothetical protein